MTEVRQGWISWMCPDEKELTAGGNLRRPGLALVTSCVKAAWDDISLELVMKSFLKTGISNRMDGTEDDYLWTDQEYENDEENENEEEVPRSTMLRQR